MLPAVENVIGWRSLFVGELRSHSFVIDRPKLAVRRDASGEIYVAGIRISGGKGDGKVTDWILSARARSWCATPRSSGSTRSARRPPLKLSALNFRLRERRRRACGRPHRASAGRARDRALKCARSSRASSVRDFAQWSGRVYRRAWLHRPRRLARLGRLPGRRAPRRRRAAALGDAGRRASSRRRPPTSRCRTSRRASAATCRCWKSRRCAAACSAARPSRGYEFGVRGLALARPECAGDEQHQLPAPAASPPAGPRSCRAVR